MLPPLSSTSRVMKIGLSSKQVSMLDLSTIAYWKINFRLMRVPGVANVAMWGERLKQLQVQVDPERMRQHGVTLDEVEADRRGSLGFRAAGVFELGQDADRRVHRDPEPKDVHPARLARLTPEDLAGVPVVVEERRHGALERRGERAVGTAASSSVTPSSTTAPA